MSESMWTIGRKGSAVIVDNGATIDLQEITGITVQAQYTQVRASPLNKPPRSYSVPNGWTGSFSIARMSRQLDDWIASKEAAFWASGSMSTGSVTLFINESDGTTSKWQFQQVSYQGQPGNFENDDVVTQTVSFTASQRVRLA